MKKILIITAIALSVISCNQDNTKSVTYVTTNAISEYHLNCLQADGSVNAITVAPESAQDEWRYSFTADQGDIVYISGYYKDINSALKIMIIVDGKIYKQASTEADTINYVTVSGTIPYE